MKKANTALGRALEKLMAPETGLFPGPRITMTGDGRVLVEGHRGLMEYGAQTVSAAVPGGCVRIKGEGLMLVAMNGRELVVSGQIWAVELE